jgi:histidine phosphotransferase ChpT
MIDIPSKANRSLPFVKDGLKLLAIKHRKQRDPRTVDHYLACLPEINCEFTADVALYLPHPPIGHARMPHQHARGQDCIQIAHSLFLTKKEAAVMGQESNFAALIGSRICHDLISPIGAINNGLELIEMSRPSLSPEMALISESVTNASARIRFFRIAFGAASDQVVGCMEISSILKDIYSPSRLSVAWAPLDGQPRHLVRLAFLALMCMETAMPYGGWIEVAREDDDVVLTGRADKYNVDEALWTPLTQGRSADNLRPAHVQFGMLPVIAADGERALVVNTSDTPITIRF